MWEISANWLLPKALKSCPKSNKLPKLVTLPVTQHWWRAFSFVLFLYPRSSSKSTLGVWRLWPLLGRNEQYLSSQLCLAIKWDHSIRLKIDDAMGSGCGSVGRAVAFDTRGPRFNSSHRQNFIEHLFIINCIEKMKINKKEAGNGPLFKKKKIDDAHSSCLLLCSCSISQSGSAHLCHSRPLSVYFLLFNSVCSR